MLGKTKAGAIATAVASAGGGGVEATRPPQLPPQKSANARGRATSRSGQLKRGRELQEADEEDEARTSRPSAKRVRHTVLGEHGKTDLTPNVAAALTAAANGPSSGTTASTAQPQKSTASRSKGKGLQSEAKEKATESSPPSTSRKTPPRLGSPFAPNAGPKQPRVRTEWDSDSDD
ncbi:MAG: hypothetical protein Q9223_000040 [Gallowayella weberi]